MAAEQGVRAWPEYAFQHVWGHRHLAEIAIYRGDISVAHERITAAEFLLRRSLHQRSQMQRVETAFTHGRVSILLGDQRGVVEQARLLERERSTYTAPLALLLRAGIAKEPITLLEKAASGADASGLGLIAACARLRRGELLHADDANARAWMKKEQIRSPERMARMVVPLAAD
jgi:hypothetical protein